MNLLCFAHRGECAVFLRRLALRPLALSFAAAWQGEGLYVLLTGEGIEPAGRTLAAFCARYEQDIAAIVNLGLAGGLDPQLERGKIYRVRTIYGEKYAGQVEHHSYTSNDQRAVHDCISARARVLDAKTGTSLANFAALVDRELWGLASVAALFKLPLHAVKLVSEVVFDAEICQRARVERDQHSNALYQFWCDNFTNASPLPHHDHIAECLVALRTQGFYFTKVLQDKVMSLLASLALKHGWQANELAEKLTTHIEIEKILTTVPQPKQRTKLLLRSLQELHDPLRAQFDQRLAAVTAPLRKVAKVTHHEDFANDDLSLASTISNHNDLTALQQALASFDYQRYRDLLNGISDYSATKVK